MLSIYVFYSFYIQNKILILLFVLFSYGIYYLLVFLFSLKKSSSNYKIDNNEFEEAIAILMPICDDFDYEAATALLTQNYKHYHIFICDDSKKEVNINRLIDWVNNNTEKCTRLYRNTNRGFKAGNLNDSEKKIPENFTLFCIIDSDQVIPENYLTLMYKEYIANSKPAFIQGIHIGRNQNNETFSNVLSGVIYPEWRYHLLYKNNYGLPTVLGHGYLIERRALTQSGGHPEVVSEDLALTMSLACINKFGIISEKIISSEIYPTSLKSITSRRFKWTMADWEIIFSPYFISFLNSKLSFIFKIDIVLREIRLPISTILGIFLCFYSIFSIINQNYSLIEINPTIIILLILSISPLFVVILCNKDYKKGFVAFLGSLFVGLGMLTVQTSAGITYFIIGKAIFYVTNNNINEESKILGPNGSLTFLIDLLYFFIYIVFIFKTKDFILIAASLAILLRILSSKNIFKTENYIIYFSIFLLGLIMIQLFFYEYISLIGLLLLLSIPLLVV